MCKCRAIRLACRLLGSKGFSFGRLWSIGGNTPCMLAHTTAEADAQGTWLLPVLISWTLAMVCALPDIKCRRYSSTLQTGSARAPQSCTTCVLNSTSYKWSTPYVTRNWAPSVVNVLHSCGVPWLSMVWMGPINRLHRWMSQWMCGSGRVLAHRGSHSHLQTSWRAGLSRSMYQTKCGQGAVCGL